MGINNCIGFLYLENLYFATALPFGALFLILTTARVSCSIYRTREIGVAVACYTTPMAKQNLKKRRQIRRNVDISIMIADVPVKIRFIHEDETLGEYEEVIDVVFDYMTVEGIAYGRRMQILKAHGLSTENAIFTIASEDVHDHALEILEKLANTEVVKRTAGHAIHMHVKRNREITYRMPVKA
jgi:hypothetical protein